MKTGLMPGGEFLAPDEKERPDPAANGEPAQEQLNTGQENINGPTAQGRPFTVWKPSEFLNYTPPEGVDFLGEGLLRRSEMCLLVGQGGLGKSRLSLWLACCQVNGLEWCGLPTKGEPARWLFIGNENSVLRWKTDLTRMKSNFNDDGWARIEDNLRLLALVEPTDAIMVLSESAHRLAQTLAEAKPEVLVLDPWAAFIPGDENNSHDTRDAVSDLFRILGKHAPKAAVLMVAHARTGREQAMRAADGIEAGGFVRGSKVLFSMARAQLNLAPGDDDDERLVLICGKTNHGPRFITRGLCFAPETFAYRVDPDFDLDEWREAVAGKRNGGTVTIADVWQTVKEGTRKAGEIEKHLVATLGAKTRTVQRMLKRAVDAGCLEAGIPRGTYMLGKKQPPGVA